MNSHQCPRYTYLKGKTIDAWGNLSVAAAPLPGPRREVPDVKILDWGFELDYLWD
jgi:hypothetical protein